MKTISINAQTGQTTIRDWTQQEADEFAAMPAPQILVPESITRRQCALQLLAIGQISAQEALNMTKTAVVPSFVSVIFDERVSSGSWTAEQRIIAEIDFAAANYYRNNSLLGLMGLTSEQIDQFFIEAVKL